MNSSILQVFKYYSSNLDIYIKKFAIRRISRLGTGRLKNELGHLTYQTIGNFV
jgi:hypothetical protein